PRPDLPSEGALQVVFDVEGDGTFHLNARELETAHAEVKKHWSTSEKHVVKVEGVRANRLPELDMPEIVPKTIEEAKQQYEDAKTSLQTARKSNNLPLIEFFRK